MVLTEEQRKKIEENRLKALAKRQQSSIKSTQHEKVEPVSSTSAVSVINKEPVKSLPASFYGGTKSRGGSEVVRKPPALQNSLPPSKVVRGSCVLISSTHFKVEMSYHASAISLFKSLPSVRYNPSDRQWTFLISDHEELIRKSRQLRPEVIIEPLPRIVVNSLTHSKSKKGEVYVNSEAEGSFRIESSLWDSLMPFQREGVLFALQRNGRILLADDMGLGKTVQALAIACAYKSSWPLLIVCPSSMRFSWKSSIKKWIPQIPEDEIYVITGGKDYLCNVQIFIINYDLMGKKQTEFLQKKFQIIIFDECHFLKNNKSQRYKSSEAISKGAKHLILLSGTPALSRPMELYSQINLVDPSLFPYPTDFGMRYCAGRKVSYGPGRECFDFSGSSNMPELKIIMEERFMIRRLKSDVITQLPSKLRQVVKLDPTVVASKLRTEMQSHAKSMNKSGISNSEKRGILLEWFHSTAIAKVKAVVEYIKDLLESGQKFICFAHHQRMIQGISDLLQKEKVDFILIDGSTSSFQREQYCTQFQTMDSKRVALLSITAANAGLTLTAAQLVVFAELFWNPGILIQAEDRAHRIGQDSNVTIQYLVASGTADDELWPMLQKKLDVLSKVGLGNENFIDADMESVQHCVSSSSGKITDYFSTSLTEESFSELFGDEDFFEDASQPKRPKN